MAIDNVASGNLTPPGVFHISWIVFSSMIYSFGRTYLMVGSIVDPPELSMQ
ncbi:MAG: hypothetical protein ABIJ00_08055 [Candidatus Eisenbacteria bacterium]